MEGDDLRRTFELSSQEARATSFPDAISLAPHDFYLLRHFNISYTFHLPLFTSFSFLEACTMAAEPEAKFAIHEAAREGKSKYIREIQIEVCH